MAKAMKRVLLVDSVIWPQGLEPDSRRDVCGWFRRWTPPSSPVEWTRVGVEADINATQSPGAWDGVILSGSPRDAWNEDPVNLQVGEWILRCRDAGVPVLGVCYGHQLMGRVLGARVSPHPEGLELGNTPVTLTPAGRASRLFEGLPDHFDVLSSHSDVVSDLPSGLSHTVAGSFAAIQGMQDSTGLLHGVQFHPETDPETLRLIWNPRRDLWRPRVRFDLDALLDHLQPTPSGPRILQNFLQHFVRG
jgi:GMP synthase (glutamine-hydrolysing)